MKIKNAISLVLLIALISGASASYAEENFFGISLGRSQASIDKGALDSDLASAGATGLTSSVKDRDTAYKIVFGHQYTPNFGLEVGYVDFGKFKYDASFSGGTANANVKADGWTVSALGLMPVGNEFSVFGKLGVIDGRIKADVSATGPAGSASGSVSDSRWRPTYGLGGLYSINKSLGLRFEFERYSRLGDKNTTGESDVDLYSLGLSVRF